MHPTRNRGGGQIINNLNYSYLKIYVLNYHEESGAIITRMFTNRQAAYLALKKAMSEYYYCAGRVLEYESNKGCEFAVCKLIYKINTNKERIEDFEIIEVKQLK